MGLQGKGWFIWQVARCERGVPQAIADKAAACGVTHVLLKVAERTYAFGFDRHGQDLVAPVARALRERGVQVWGWHYVYGDKPVDEARISLQRAVSLQLDGFVVDAEAHYKQPGKAAAARAYMATLRSGLPSHVPVALSSYRFPSLHRQFPWEAFLELCDLNMPQVYWEQAHNPERQLDRALKEFADEELVGHVRPVVPTGSAYGAGNWRAEPEDLARFLERAREHNLPAANFYSWDYAASAGHTDLWQAVAAFDWPVDPEAQFDVVGAYVAALNAGDIEQVLSLYDPAAGHVTAERTIVGRDRLAQWYRTLLGSLLPGAEFRVTGVDTHGNSRRFWWQATGPHSRVLDGDDTFGLLNGRIQYHYTYFTVRPAVPA